MFRFKQFSIQDDNATMKVGTDSVLLGCMVNVSNPKRILDIGTGCGIIALILAQQFPNATIDAIDIDEGSISDAKQNFERSLWSNILTPHLSSLQEWDKDCQYDLIVSNPPYFVNTLRCPSDKRNMARHNDTLSFEDLIVHTKRLMATEGDFWCILPPTEAEEVIHLATAKGLSFVGCYHIHNKPESAIRRTILHFSKALALTSQDQHRHLRNADSTYSDWYHQTTKDFYLWEWSKE